MGARRARPLHQHEPVPVNDLIRPMRQKLAHLGALQPDDLGQLAGGVVDYALAYYRIVGGDLDGITGGEVAIDADDADRQKA